MVKNEIFQTSAISSKKSYFSSTENYKKPRGSGIEKIEAFQNRLGTLGKQDPTVEIRKSI